MQITVSIPDELTASLIAGQDPSKAALEAFALEAYPARRLSYQLRKLLNIPSGHELEGFLKQHQVYNLTIRDFEHDLATIRKLEERRNAERPE